jgi:hypothetical protein
MPERHSLQGGGVPERTNGTVLKTVEAQVSEGSNPSPSAGQGLFPVRGCYGNREATCGITAATRLNRARPSPFAASIEKVSPLSRLNERILSSMSGSMGHGLSPTC